MPALFTPLGLWAIYRATDGYPRRIITLCHQILLTLIIQNKMKAGWTIVRSATGRLMPDTIRKRRWATAALLSVLAFALTAFLFFLPKPLNIIPPSTAVQPLPNPVESAPFVTSPVTANSDKDDRAAAYPAGGDPDGERTVGGGKGHIRGICTGKIAG